MPTVQQMHIARARAILLCSIWVCVLGCAMDTCPLLLFVCCASMLLSECSRGVVMDA